MKMLFMIFNARLPFLVRTCIPHMSVCTVYASRPCTYSKSNCILTTCRNSVPIKALKHGQILPVCIVARRQPAVGGGYGWMDGCDIAETEFSKSGSTSKWTAAPSKQGPLCNPLSHFNNINYLLKKKVKHRVSLCTCVQSIFF